MQLNASLKARPPVSYLLQLLSILPCVYRGCDLLKATTHRLELLFDRSAQAEFLRPLVFGAQD